MTICIAALFRFNYGDTGFGTAAITASDRMITAADSKFEPNQIKMGELTPRIVALVAGDYTVHSQALQETKKQLSAMSAPTPYNASVIYGGALQRIGRTQAEDRYLAPLNLNTDTFHAQQREFSDGFIAMVTGQLQDYAPPDCQALIVGSDGDVVQLYHVDQWGTSRNYCDAGFAAIGAGASHANSSLMQAGYTNMSFMAPAWASVFAAKKRAEVAPGVGKATDMVIVRRDGWFSVHDELIKESSRLYDEYESARANLTREGIKDLSSALESFARQEEANRNAGQAGIPDEDTQTNGSDDADASEVARPDEGGPESESAG